jgi:hypothetical protein
MVKPRLIEVSNKLRLVMQGWMCGFNWLFEFRLMKDGLGFDNVFFPQAIFRNAEPKFKTGSPRDIQGSVFSPDKSIVSQTASPAKTNPSKLE